MRELHIHPSRRHQCDALSKANQIHQSLLHHRFKHNFRIGAVVGSPTDDIVMHLGSGCTPSYYKALASQVRPVELPSVSQFMSLSKCDVYTLFPKRRDFTISKTAFAG